MAGIGYAAAPHYKAYPGSFIGRQIGFYKIGHVDLNAENSYHGRLDSENFRLAIQTIQTQAEILFIGTPVVSNQWGRFIVGLSVDTANTNAPVFEGDNSMAVTLQNLLRAVSSLNDNSNLATVERLWLYGDELVNFGYLDSAIVANTSTTYTGFAEGSVEQNELIQLDPTFLDITNL